MENNEISARSKENNSETSSKNATLAAETSNGATSATSSHKMGSRRIFTPQFKLQVLESYRNDNDCKGNQRATARKYNIHRRQIQKWLQCESSLRSSVANINQNTVKHQFHNISMHQQQTQKAPIPSAASMGVAYGSNNQHPHSEAAMGGSMMVPVMSTGVTTSPTQTQGVFSAANLAAVVAAAAGAMTITSAPSNGGSAASESVTSPLRSSSMIGVGVSGSTTATMSPLLHHHHYGMPSYIHTPASVQLSVPILTHHITHPQHIHQQSQQHQSYQYHNLAYTQALTRQSDKQQSSSFLSSLSLPDINALSAAASTSAPSSSDNGFTLVGEADHPDAVEALRLGVKTGSENVLETNSLDQNCQHKIVYQCGEYRGVSHPKALHTSIYQFKGEVYHPLLYPLGPMDLSLRPRRDEKLHMLPNIRTEGDGTNDMGQRKSNESTSIVDLTHRKRKGADSSCNAVDDNQCELSEKQPKLQDSVGLSRSKCAADTNCDEDEVEIEVGTEEKLPPSKPVKLFKPYLLDEDADTDNSVTCSSRSTETRFGESCESTSPWISYTANHSPTHCYDSSTGPCQGTTFQYSLKDTFSSTSDAANFHSETKSAFTSIPATSPTFFRCPKGSPSSSGYESSSSTYSDSSLSSRAESSPFARTYSINLQMHPIHNDNIKMHPSKHVERWLEQEA